MDFIFILNSTTSVGVKPLCFSHALLTFVNVLFDRNFIRVINYLRDLILTVGSVFL
jgi:hypothetical protein